MEYKLQPFIMLQRHTLNQLQEKDAEDIFAHPVSEEEVRKHFFFCKYSFFLTCVVAEAQLFSKEKLP